MISGLLYFMELKSPVRYCLFDLDNTLYDASSPMLKRINILITRYIMDMFDISFQQAQTLRREAFHTYGTTLRWLKKEHGFRDEDHYLDYIHPKDVHWWVEQHEDIRGILSSVPVSMSILTNSAREHAERVLGHFGVLDCFEKIYDIRFNNHISKPDRRAYIHVLEDLGLPTEEVLFIDDNPAFAEAFKELGGQGMVLDYLGIHEGYPGVYCRSLESCAAHIKRAAPTQP